MHNRRRYGYRACQQEQRALLDAVGETVVRRRQLGTSVLGRTIDRLSTGDEGLPHVLLVGAVHANEWVTAAVAMRVMRWAIDVAQSAWQQVQFTVVPMLNPDGVEQVVQGRTRSSQQWKANARGVDLNDQFPAGWARERWRRGVHCPGARDFGGPYPLSEPEARALVRWIECEEANGTPVQTLLALHTQGEEIYWNYRDFEPDGAQTIVEEMARRSGYRAVRLMGSDAGLKDWFIRRWRRPGFTIECGRGCNPIPWEQVGAMTQAVQSIVDVARTMRIM